jgi:hypothetical protein
MKLKVHHSVDISHEKRGRRRRRLGSDVKQKLCSHQHLFVSYIPASVVFPLLFIYESRHRQIPPPTRSIAWDITP